MSCGAQATSTNLRRRGFTGRKRLRKVKFTKPLPRRFFVQHNSFVVSFVEIVRTDVEKEHAIIGEKYKLDAVVVVYPKCPRPILFAVQFVRAKRRMKWIFSEEWLFLLRGNL